MLIHIYCIHRFGYTSIYKYNYVMYVYVIVVFLMEGCWHAIIFMINVWMYIVQMWIYSSTMIIGMHKYEWMCIYEFINTCIHEIVVSINFCFLCKWIFKAYNCCNWMYMFIVLCLCVCILPLYIHICTCVCCLYA